MPLAGCRETDWNIDSVKGSLVILKQIVNMLYLRFMVLC